MRINRAPNGGFPFSPAGPPLPSPLHPGRVRALVVFRRCCWRKVESTWGRVASMAPAANGRAALQTLISCRFRGPSRFYLSASKSAPGGSSPLPASGPSVAADTLPCPFAPASDLHGTAFDQVRYPKFHEGLRSDFYWPGPKLRSLHAAAIISDNQDEARRDSEVGQTVDRETSIPRRNVACFLFASPNLLQVPRSRILLPPSSRPTWSRVTFPRWPTSAHPGKRTSTFCVCVCRFENNLHETGLGGTADPRPGLITFND